MAVLSAMTVHPRACGERSSDRPSPGLEVGSSPRVRGTRRNGRISGWRSVHPRACGERSPIACIVASTVHPRACGERWISHHGPSLGGSSPRVRGTPYSQAAPAVHAVHPRACGERRRQPHRDALGTVHPRACGERGTPAHERLTASRFIPARAGNATVIRHRPFLGRFIPARAGNTSWTDRSRFLVGSSPRVRGTHVSAMAGISASRFIPARAGNAGSRLEGSGPSPVHPRACGERAPCNCTALTRVGSSPRVRGTRATARRRLCIDDGSSPRVRGTLSSVAIAALRSVHPRACGERPIIGRWSRSRKSVHPRACGERGLADCHAPHVGSSPRVRGTRVTEAGTRDRDRFIPARAGNARCIDRRRCRSVGSSPRVRGTPVNDGAVAFAMIGSSPRVRGTPTMDYALNVRRRFIPARAGNACGRSSALCHRSVHPRACGERSLCR